MMDLLKRENWFIWLLLCFLTQGLSNVILAYFLGCFDRNAWYAKGRYWLLGGVCLFLPLIIMVIVLIIQLTIEVGRKLSVPGEAIYGCPYIWILCVIIPIIGWIMFLVMSLYIAIWPIIMLKRGNGENYLV